MPPLISSPITVDLHSHVLPGIDDGSRDITESLALLRLLHDQGVSIVCATPHFHTHGNTIETFLSQRERAVRELRLAADSDCPEIRLGAEISYYDGISRSDSIRELAIEGTPLLLVEMPFGAWSQRMISDIIALNSSGHVRVILAHIERYLLLEPPSVFSQLLHSGVLMQSNADFFLSRYGKRVGLHMLKKGRLHALGSDCHSTGSRPPRIAEAAAHIRSVGGEDALEPLILFDRAFFPL